MKFSEYINVEFNAKFIVAGEIHINILVGQEPSKHHGKADHFKEQQRIYLFIYLQHIVFIQHVRSEVSSI